MILTDREIQIAIERGLIKIDPRPTEKAFSSTSVDLTLDPSLTKFKTQKAGVETVIDPNHVDFSPESSLADLTDTIEIVDDGWPLPPKILFLGWTREYVDLKTDARLAARVEGKSSLARLGLGIHVTAPTIHSGFKRPDSPGNHQPRIDANQTAPRDADMPTHLRSDVGHSGAWI